MDPDLRRRRPLDRLADHLVDEPPGVVGPGRLLDDEAGGDDLLQRRRHPTDRAVGGRGCDRNAELRPAHRRGLEERPGHRRQAGPSGGRRARRSSWGPAPESAFGAQQLGHPDRVARRLAPHPPSQLGVADHLGHGLHRETREPEPFDPGPGQLDAEELREGVRPVEGRVAERGHDQQRRRGGGLDHRADGEQRGAVRPVQVVEDQQHRSALGTRHHPGGQRRAPWRCGRARPRAAGRGPRPGGGRARPRTPGRRRPARSPRRPPPRPPARRRDGSFRRPGSPASSTSPPAPASALDHASRRASSSSPRPTRGPPTGASRCTTSKGDSHPLPRSTSRPGDLSTPR